MLSAACGGSSHVAPPPILPDEGKHHDDVAAQVKPYLDAEIVGGLVIGLYDAGKIEIYGFGKGPHDAPPDGTTLFELGPATQVYTSLLFADAVQRKALELDTPVADLLPPGVTMPTRDQIVVTLRHLVMHASGLPRWPPSLAAKMQAPDPYAGYDEDALFRDLIRTELINPPGSTISYSNYGAGLLGFLLGKKLGGGFPKLVTDRILVPLELKDSSIGPPPPALAARRAQGTTDDLAPAQPWTFDAMAGAAGLVTSARDQLKLIEAEQDAAAGGSLALRHAMKLTQEPALDRTGDNEGMGWNIDSAGRYWHNGGTGGFHAFIGFDPKTKHGVVILASTATTLIDRLADAMYKMLDSAPPAPVAFIAPAQLTALAGNYEINGTKLAVAIEGGRMYFGGAGEPHHRMVPLSDHEVWIEVLQNVAVFEKEGDRVVRLVLGVGDHMFAANRVGP
ncbi:MAG TPA: serine hydrolase domain-containing protein [Kofleriaceae bacterium]|nr:serine hydrolase domain-containing protein [Kofleriaceae bacterium]